MSEFEEDIDSEDTTAFLPVRRKSQGERKARKGKKKGSGTRSHGSSGPGHLAWLKSLKHDERGYIQTYAHTPRHKTSTEYFAGTLRSTVPVSSSKMTTTLTGLPKGHKRDFPYQSSSHYLRQVAGTEKQMRPRSASAAGRNNHGTPAYKSQEEYYEEIMNLKKQVRSLVDDNTTLRSKMSRLEKDNLKKERDIEQLLDPGKSAEMRRTLADRKPDAGAVIHSLKQKALKLEHQLRDKEASYKKIQGEMKYTKAEELRVQLEMLHREVTRLNTLKGSGADTHRGRNRRGDIAGNGDKMKALNEVVIRLSKDKQQLQEQNRKLMADLNHAQDSADKGHEVRAHYGRMTDDQMLDKIGSLEKKLAKYEGDGADRKKGSTKGKIEVSGSQAERLNQLDKRESQLLRELTKEKNKTKGLEEENRQLRMECQDKGAEIEDLLQDIEDLKAGRPVTPHSSRPSSRGASRASSSRATPVPAQRRPNSARSVRSTASDRRRREDEEEDSERERRVNSFKEKHAAKTIQREWKQHQIREVGQRREREWDENHSTRRKKAEDLRERHAALKIQRGWHEHTYDNAALNIQGALRSHVGRKKKNAVMRRRLHEESEEEFDDDIALIQGALRGHSARRQVIKRNKKGYPTDTDSELDNAVGLVQNSYKGHKTRKKSVERFRGMRLDSEGEEMENDRPRSRDSRRSVPGSRKPSTTSGRPGSRGSTRSGAGLFGSGRITPSRGRARLSDDDDDDIMF